MERIGAAALRDRRPVVSQQRLRSTLGWWLTAALLAVVVAGATYVDVKMGFAAAIGLAGVLVVLQHPPLLAPIAIVTICVEGIVVSGVAVTRLLAPCALLLVLAELLRGGARIRVASPLLWGAAYTMWA